MSEGTKITGSHGLGTWAQPKTWSKDNPTDNRSTALEKVTTEDASHTFRLAASKLAQHTSSKLRVYNRSSPDRELVLKRKWIFGAGRREDTAAVMRALAEKASSDLPPKEQEAFMKSVENSLFKKPGGAARTIKGDMLQRLHNELEQRKNKPEVLANQPQRISARILLNSHPNRSEGAAAHEAPPPEEAPQDILNRDDSAASGNLMGQNRVTISSRRESASLDSGSALADRGSRAVRNSRVSLAELGGTHGSSTDSSSFMEGHPQRISARILLNSYPNGSEGAAAHEAPPPEEAPQDILNQDDSAASGNLMGQNRVTISSRRESAPLDSGSALADRDSRAVRNARVSFDELRGTHNSRSDPSSFREDHHFSIDRRDSQPFLSILESNDPGVRQSISDYVSNSQEEAGEDEYNQHLDDPFRSGSIRDRSVSGDSRLSYTGPGSAFGLNDQVFNLAVAKGGLRDEIQKFAEGAREIANFVDELNQTVDRFSTAASDLDKRQTELIETFTDAPDERQDITALNEKKDQLKKLLYQPKEMNKIIEFHLKAESLRKRVKSFLDGTELFQSEAVDRYGDGHELGEMYLQTTEIRDQLQDLVKNLDNVQVDIAKAGKALAPREPDFTALRTYQEKELDAAIVRHQTTLDELPGRMGNLQELLSSVGRTKNAQDQAISDIDTGELGRANKRLQELSELLKLRYQSASRLVSEITDSLHWAEKKAFAPDSDRVAQLRGLLERATSEQKASKPELQGISIRQMRELPQAAATVRSYRNDDALRQKLGEPIPTGAFIDSESAWRQFYATSDTINKAMNLAGSPGFVSPEQLDRLRQYIAPDGKWMKAIETSFSASFDFLEKNLNGGKFRADSEDERIKGNRKESIAKQQEILGTVQAEFDEQKDLLDTITAQGKNLNDFVSYWDTAAEAKTKIEQLAKQPNKSFDYEESKLSLELRNAENSIAESIRALNSLGTETWESDADAVERARLLLKNEYGAAIDGALEAVATAESDLKSAQEKLVALSSEPLELADRSDIQIHQRMIDALEDGHTKLIERVEEFLKRTERQ